MTSDDRPMWGIHMDRSFGNTPISNDFIAIGWDEVGDLSSQPATREAFKKAVALRYPNAKPGAIPVIAGTLFKFATEIAVGDKVIYPSKSDRKVNLGVIKSGYRFDPSKALGMCPNRRDVTWTHQFERTEFSQSALHEIGSAITLFQVKNNAEEFLAAFEGKLVNTEDVDAETAHEAAVTTTEATEDFIIKRLKSSLTPYQFEKFVAHLLERMGYHARVTQASGDGGIDIIAHKDELGFEDPLIKVQCKQTLSTIGQPDVSQLYGHVDNKEFGLFVSLGDYSSQARQFEANQIFGLSMEKN